MKAINYTSLRGQMKGYMDMICDTFETLIVTRKNGRNVVMMSEETYNNLIENSYLTSNKANYDWLINSKKQLENSQDLIRKDIRDL